MSFGEHLSGLRFEDTGSSQLHNTLFLGDTLKGFLKGISNTAYTLGFINTPIRFDQERAGDS